jgi:hypothetical protein
VLKFLKGTSSATVYNFGTEPHVFTLSAKPGQTLIVKPVITSALVKETPKVVITDGAKSAMTVDGKPASFTLRNGNVTLEFTGDGYTDIAIR